MNKLLSKLRVNFMAGILVTLPLLITYEIVKFIIVKVKVLHFANVVTPEWIEQPVYFRYIITAIVVLIILAAIFIILTVVGMLARNVIGKRLILFGESILAKIPVVNKIYRAVQQISHAFVGKVIFARVVLLQYPRKGIYSIGFVTSDTKGEIGTEISKDSINVFLPTTPNPTSGYLLFVSEKDTIPLSMSVEDAMKLVISGGAVTPNYNK
ncbi:MAG: DUF502 domain-containing protein [bacterium]|nr:DUF502 domain-containing protein [bacterium]